MIKQTLSNPQIILARKVHFKKYFNLYESTGDLGGEFEERFGALKLLRSGASVAFLEKSAQQNGRRGCLHISRLEVF